MILWSVMSSFSYTVPNTSPPVIGWLGFIEPGQVARRRRRGVGGGGGGGVGKVLEEDGETMLSGRAAASPTGNAWAVR